MLRTNSPTLRGRTPGTHRWISRIFFLISFSFAENTRPKEIRAVPQTPTTNVGFGSKNIGKDLG